MKCLNDKCNKDFESNNPRRIYCSDACKLQHFRKHGKRGEIKEYKIDVLLNAVCELKEKIEQLELQKPINTSISGLGIVPALLASEKKSVIEASDNFNSRIKNAKSISGLEEIVKEIWASDLLWSEKKAYENYAKEISKEFYSD